VVNKVIAIGNFTDFVCHLRIFHPSYGFSRLHDEIIVHADIVAIVEEKLYRTKKIVKVEVEEK